jgi:hypothetical protein
VGKNAPTFLHDYDMRIYFPIAKYFPELRFDGVYAASAAVVAEDPRGFVELERKTMTNLRTHETQTIGQSGEYIREVRSRFSPERWAAFAEDMGYFRRAMGDANFVSSMYDHGGNATPVWFLGARLLFAGAPASDRTLWLGVAIDALLLLLAFASLAWAYGPKTALIGMTVFGAMDFYLFGNNWFGASLRHDWLSLWCLGLALLKKERFFLAGGLLTWSALIRAFPALSLLTLTVPVAWALSRELLTQRGRFSLAAFLRGQRDFVRVFLGSVVFGTVLLSLSVLVFGAGAWPDWGRKIALMMGAGLNTVGLASIFSDPWVRGGVMAAIVLTTGFALRRARLHQAAAFGPVLLGVVLNPMNYYLHCLFLPATLGSPKKLFPWLALLAMCVGCFFTTQTPAIDLHFRQEARVMLAAVLGLVGWQLAQSLKREPVPVAAPSPEAPLPPPPAEAPAPG